MDEAHPGTTRAFIASLIEETERTRRRLTWLEKVLLDYGVEIGQGEAARPGHSLAVQDAAAADRGSGKGAPATGVAPGVHGGQEGSIPSEGAQCVASSGAGEVIRIPDPVPATDDERLKAAFPDFTDMVARAVADVGSPAPAIPSPTGVSASQTDPSVSPEAEVVLSETPGSIPGIPLRAPRKPINIDALFLEPVGRIQIDWKAVVVAGPKGHWKTHRPCLEVLAKLAVTPPGSFIDVQDLAPRGQQRDYLVNSLDNWTRELDRIGLQLGRIGRTGLFLTVLES